MCWATGLVDRPPAAGRADLVGRAHRVARVDLLPAVALGDLRREPDALRPRAKSIAVGAS